MRVEFRLPLWLFIAVMSPLPGLGCASTAPDRSAVVDVSTRQTAPTDRVVMVERTGDDSVVAEEDDDNGGGFISKVFGADTDGDGIADNEDQCPDVAEDRDGFLDHDGCPDIDNDRDGIPDTVDKCPNAPETMNGFEDEDGCPDASLDRAKQAFRNGATAYAQSDFAMARKYFEEAFRLEPRDALLFNLARTAEKQGDRKAACQYYRQWRATSMGASSTDGIKTLDTCP